MHLVAHLQNAQANANAKFCKRATKQQHKDRPEMTTNKHDRKEGQHLTAVTLAQTFLN